MKNIFINNRKGSEKTDANITMNTHGAFNTGGFGNAKIGGRDKGTYFIAFIPLLCAIAFAFTLSLKSNKEDEAIKNPIQTVATVNKIINYTHGRYIQYSYEYNCRPYTSEIALKKVKKQDFNIGDKVIITIDKDEPGHSSFVKLKETKKNN